MTVLEIVYLSSAVAGAVWLYSWPYGEGNICTCQERDVGSYMTFPTAEECLKSFALEENEYCTYENEGGVSLHDCDSAVATQVGVTNEDCHRMCGTLVIGSESFEEFSANCRFEFVTKLPNAVVPVKEGCFSNYVFGWSDYDSNNSLQRAPLKVLPDVDTASECQSMCQITPDCVAFTWRGVEGFDHEPKNSALTCTLYDAEYIKGVFSTGVDSSAQGNTGNEYCDYQSYNAACPDLKSVSFDPFNDEKCLLCGCMRKCAWKDNAHISGPAFCNSQLTDVCDIIRPRWTTTSTPAPSCPTAATCGTESVTSGASSEPIISTTEAGKPTCESTASSGINPCEDECDDCTDCCDDCDECDDCDDCCEEDEQC